MSYKSIDALQKELSQRVFSGNKDAKKSAGRALGTFVEIITYYLLDSWGLSNNLEIETPLPEFANSSITHNVEFTMHPCLTTITNSFQRHDLPISTRKIFQNTNIYEILNYQDCEIFSLDDEKIVLRNDKLIDQNGQVKNACILASSRKHILTSTVHSFDISSQQGTFLVNKLLRFPFAMFECKRVGVEEGMSKGPQTIEKAKQGAYVSRMVSALQRFRLRNGGNIGILELPDGSFSHGEYYSLLKQLINNKANNQLLNNFVLTVGIISNHGNWFTADSRNKELDVLSQSYDWLVFLTDDGLAEFVTLLSSDLLPYTRKAFQNCYPRTEENKSIRFTKTNIDMLAHLELKRYFEENRNRISQWFNLISPVNGTIGELKEQLNVLAAKRWEEIYK